MNSKSVVYPTSYFKSYYNLQPLLNETCDGLQVFKESNEEVLRRGVRAQQLKEGSGYRLAHEGKNNHININQVYVEFGRGGSDFLFIPNQI